MEELPYNLREELQAFINNQMCLSVNFFNGKDKNFLRWIATVVKSTTYEEKELIYKEGDIIHQSKIHFINKFSIFSC
jgi:hypothetical protein